MIKKFVLYGILFFFVMSVSEFAEAVTSNQIDIPLKTWVAIDAPNNDNSGPRCSSFGGCKHMRFAHNPDDGRIYVIPSRYQTTYSLDLFERFNDISNPLAGWRMEYPNCGGDIQPKNPDLVTWVYDTKRKFFWMIPGYSGDVTHGCTEPDTILPKWEIMTFDPVAKKWDLPDRTEENSGIGSELLNGEYDPVTDTIIRFREEKVYSYNITSDTWTVIPFPYDKNGVEIGISSIAKWRGQSAIDLKNRHIYFIAVTESRLYRYYIDTQELEYLIATPEPTWPNPLDPASSAKDRMMPVWDSINDVLLWPEIFSNSGRGLKFHVYHPDTNSWEADLPLTQPAGQDVEVRGNHAVFDPIQNVLMIMGGSSQHPPDDSVPPNPYIFLYRYGNGDGTSPTCTDNDGDGYGVGTGCLGSDCDDSDANIPGVEGPQGDVTCADSVDNDCDNLIDNADTGCVGGNNNYLPNLGSNEWVQVIPENSQRYIPRDAQPSNNLETTSMPLSRSYSGIHYGDGKLFYYGGGHGSYPGNDVEIYDIDNNMWDQSYKPEVCNMSDDSCNGLYGGAGSPAITPLGRPYVEHTYEQLAWDDVSNKLFAVLKSGTWTFDPVSMEWNNMITGVFPGDPSTSHIHVMDYDPDLGAFQVVVNSDGVYKFENNVWKRRSGVPVGVNFHSGELYSTYIPDQKIHIVLNRKGDNGWWKYDAVQDTWTALTNVPNGANRIRQFDYDTKNKLLIGLEFNYATNYFNMWSYDISSDQWSAINLQNKPPYKLGGMDSVSVAPIFRYSQGHNAFLYVYVKSVGSGFSGGTGSELWAYRYGGGGSCTPEPLSTTCGSWTCGSKTNNCGQTVNCSPGCNVGEVCSSGTCTPESQCIDADGDGYGSPASGVCTFPILDCNDHVSSINPGATEGPSGSATCSDNMDNDCDLLIDGSDSNCLSLSNLIINTLSLNYEVVYNGLQSGSAVYTDRSYTYSGIPGSLLAQTYIKTANDDKGSTGSSFFSFDVNQNVTVYVGHDDRSLTKPAWLASFTATGNNIVTTDATFSLYSRDYSAGTVFLGGNEGGGGSSMYTIIVTGQGDIPNSDKVAPNAPSKLRKLTTE